jgi:hypothetical protein
MLVQIDSGYFNCGIILIDDVCTSAAPIAKFAIGKPRAWLSRYFKQRGWKAIVVEEYDVEEK